MHGHIKSGEIACFFFLLKMMMITLQYNTYRTGVMGGACWLLLGEVLPFLKQTHTSMRGHRKNEPRQTCCKHFSLHKWTRKHWRSLKSKLELSASNRAYLTWNLVKICCAVQPLCANNQKQSQRHWRTTCQSHWRSKPFVVFYRWWTCVPSILVKIYSAVQPLCTNEDRQLWHW